MRQYPTTRQLATVVAISLTVAAAEWRPRAAGTISGVVFEDFNGNGLRNTTTTIANEGAGTVPTAFDRGVSGIVVTVYDAAGVVRGSATTAAGGTYSIAATGTGPYRVEFTGLPTGYRPTAFAAGASGNGTTVQFVPDGNSANVNLGILDAANYCQNNPTLVTSCFVFGGEPPTGPYPTEPTLVDFPYSSGANSATASDYADPTTHPLMVQEQAIGSVFGLGYRSQTNRIYAAAFMKKHSRYGPNGPGAIYLIDPSPGTGSPTLFADLDAIFGAGTTGGDAHAGNGGNYDTDNGNTAWDAVGKTSLGGLEVSPDGAFVFVVNLADRRVYRLPTTGPLTPATVTSVSIPLNAPGATGGGADLRPFALQYHKGVLYVGLVNSAESSGATVADLRAYVYTLDPATLVFGASPALQFSLVYPRGAVQAFNPPGPGEWNRWSPTYVNESPDGTATYPQPMLTGLAFDVDGNLTLGLRDRAGDQLGYFTRDNPASTTRQEGVAGGDTLFAAINTPGDFSSGWTLESNAQAGSFGPTAGAGNNQGPGTVVFGEYYFSDAFAGLHEELSGGSLLQLPGFPDVMTSAFDPGLTVRTGGFMWLREADGTKTKGYDLYDTGFVTPPAPTFSKANGFGEVVAICQAAPIEIGNRVWNDLDGDGVQDPGEPGLDGVSVQLIAPGGAVLATVVTANGGQYYFSSTTIAGLLPNTSGYTLRLPPQGALSGFVLTGANTDPSANGDSRDSDAVASGANVEIAVSTGPAGDNAHTYDFGFTAPVLSLGNFVWYDTNDNGAVDAGELPIDGVDVVLYRDNGDGVFNATTDTLIGTQTTAGGGLYLFTGLTAGPYFVQIPAAEFGAGQTLSGYQNSSGQTAGDSNNVDHGAPAPVSGQGVVSDLVALTVGGEPTNDGDASANSNLTIDFGFYRLSLGNLVFDDNDNSGTFNAGDVARDGVVVELLDASGTTVLASTMTTGGGLYQFTGLTPGDYRVRITPPPGLVSSTGGGSEPGIGPNNNADNDDNGTQTGAVILSAAITLTPGAEPVVDGTLGATTNPTLDFGLIPAAGLSLGNLVWRDDNNDGVVSAGEPGIDGVTVRLFDATGTTVLGTQTTAGGGFYLFTGLAAGDYIVEVLTPTGFSSSSGGSTEPAPDPDNDTNNDDNGTTNGAVVRSLPVTLALGAEPTTDGDTNANSNLSVDFGFVPSAPSGTLSLGNLVWLDTNDNGRVDAGETGLAGVTVRLVAADGVTVLATTTTNASGQYLFSGLAPGTYFVEVVPPAAMRSSTDIPGSGTPDNDTDNDDNGVTSTPTGIRSGPITLASGAEPTSEDGNANTNLTVDFGFVPQTGTGIEADVCLAQQLPTAVAPGGQMTVVYSTTNRGPGQATDVVIDGMLPPGVTVASTSPSPGGACTVSSGMLDCRWLGSTPAGPAGVRSVSVVFQVASSVAPGTPLMLWFMTSASNSDPYPACNMVDGYVFVSGGSAPPVDLRVDASAVSTWQSGATLAATVGQPMTARFTVTNAGGATARGHYAVLLDEAGIVDVTSAAVSQGSAAAGSATSATWDTGPIPAGGAATLSLSLVPRQQTGTRIQLVRFDGAPADPNAVNDSAELVIDAVGTGGGRFVAAGELDGVAGDEIIAGAGQGETPQVKIYSGAGASLATFSAFDRAFRGGVRLATCDVDGNGVDELIAAQGPGGGRVRVLSLAGGTVTERAAFDAFEPAFAGGVNVACGDLDGDGRAEVVVGPEAGRAPDVKVFAVPGSTASVAAQFQAYEPTFLGGVRVGASRFTGSAIVGPFSVVTAPGPGRTGEVRAFAISGGGGVLVAAAPLVGSMTGARVLLDDVTGDATPELVIAPDAGAPLLIQVFSLSTGSVVLSAPPGAGGFGSVHLAAAAIGGGRELVLGSGAGQAPTVVTVALGAGGSVTARLVFASLETP